MSDQRDRAEYTIGGYWLTKRRDGKSPDIWQIATYSAKSRSVIYRSTKRRTVELEAAKAILRSYEAAERSKEQDQRADQSEVVPHLFNYLREHGPDVIRLDTVKSSFRAWIGFLQQDELGVEAVVSDLHKVTLTRFRRWRMGPHSYEVEWGGKTFRHTSKGVKGETVQRNIEDLRAAINHAEGANRISAPRLPSVDKKLRSEPRDTLLTVKQLGAMLGYARQDIGAYRWLALMVATASRPGPALAFQPNAFQWPGDIIDLHPEGTDRTDKRNAVVPAIDPVLPILKDWRESPHPVVKSRKRWWNTMRQALGMPEEVQPYTIRHTVATYMDDGGVPGAQLSAIAGHLPSSRGLARTTSKHYLHYDPRNCPKAKKVLTKLFRAVMAEADHWSADHRRTIPLRGQPISVAKVGRNV